MPTSCWLVMAQARVTPGTKVMLALPLVSNWPVTGMLSPSNRTLPL